MELNGKCLKGKKLNLVELKFTQIVKQCEKWSKRIIQKKGFKIKHIKSNVLPDTYLYENGNKKCDIWIPQIQASVSCPT